MGGQKQGRVPGAHCLGLLQKAGENVNVFRQRMLDAFEFNHPDKIPVVYHPSPAGLYVHGQKLLDLFNEYPPDNPVTFNSIPTPSPGAIDQNGRFHAIEKDQWGTEWEYLIHGIAGHPRNYPFTGWEEAADYTFPPVTCFSALDLAKVAAQRRDYLVFSGWISIFEKLHALRPMDEVLMDLYTEDRRLMVFLDRLVGYWMKTINEMMEANIDVIVFADDWGTQFSTLVSPDLFRKIFKPRYEKLMAPVKTAGRKIFFHSCGFLGEIFDELLGLGIDGLWPQITQVEHNPAFTEKCREHHVAIYIHPDRQRLIPLGAPREIETAIQGYAEKYHRLGGGGIFYVEVENDAPFENVAALIRAIHKFR